MKIKLIFSIVIFSITFVIKSMAYMPHPDHVVVLILENTSYNEIIGSSAAPYINSLLSDNKCALFTQSYGLTRPSQPNYLQLFSGSTQGVTTNNLPVGIPFTTPNLGAQLLAASKTFMGYSETMPSVGYTGEVFGAYARKHNPWVNWQGATTNGIPAALNETYLAFPSAANYSSLPHLSIVVPNQDNDMHNGTLPTRVTIGDTWVQNNMAAYIQWAKSHNSLFILTFDEDDFIDQHIVTLFIGPMVQPGSYSNYIDHYSLLGLMEDMFYLPRIAGAIGVPAIDYCWSPCYQNSIVTPNGSTSLCQGGNVTLTAFGGASYLWSNGSTQQSITVSTAGNYTVAVNDGAGCTSTSSPTNVTVNTFNYSGNVFSESMGTVSATTLITAHETNNGFDNDALTMTGTGDLRNNTNSSGYTNASGLANVFLTNTVGKTFSIEGINTTGLSNLQLSFGVYKSTTTSTGSDLLVQYSSDGVNYLPFSFTALTAGSGTAIWYYRLATTVNPIPATTNLRIRFMQNGTATQYRIDDVSLRYTITNSQITAGGPVTFCQGANVTLSSTLANTYLWSNGATMQNINVTTSGNYQVVVTGNTSCTASSNVITVTVNPVPAITGLSPTNGSPGTFVTINGSNFSTVTSLKFNGTSTAFTIVNNSQITAYVPSGATSGFVSVTNNCTTVNSAQTFTVNIVPSVLQLKMFIEGYYLGANQMKNVLGGSNCDSVTVELRSPNSPYNLVYSFKTVINISGIGNFNFPSAANGNSFYIVAYGHNSLKTWAASPIIFSSSTSYDFTTSANMAYGSNLKNLVDGNFAMYSGEITSDGVINLSDHASVKNSAISFFTGYNKNDLNGDSIVESTDFSIVENNFNIVSIQP